jgi:uncharacterized membrane protein YeiH
MDTPPLTSATLLLTLDLLGTFVFAMSGAAAGVKNRLDIFGVCVLGFVAATAGGLTRDVLIGAIPPAVLSDWRYLATSLAAAAVTFVWYPQLKRLNSLILIFDAAGLALFAVAGTEKALAYGLAPGAAALLGMLTGIGGGVVRDMLVNEVPVVLRADLYAVAALAGAAVVVLGELLHLPGAPTAAVGAAVCFLMRLVAIRRGVNLPMAGDASRDAPRR